MEKIEWQTVIPTFGPSKFVLACALVIDYRFSSKNSYSSFMLQLCHKPYAVQVLEARICDDGSVLARISKQYNCYPLIDLPHSDLEV